MGQTESCVLDDRRALLLNLVLYARLTYHGNFSTGDALINRTGVLANISLFWIGFKLSVKRGVTSNLRRAWLGDAERQCSSLPHHNARQERVYPAHLINGLRYIWRYGGPAQVSANGIAETVSR